MAKPIPAEVIFNPHWWYRNYGISFDESFYFDRALRIQNDLQMRRALYERFRLGAAQSGAAPDCGIGARGGRLRDAGAVRMQNPL